MGRGRSLLTAVSATAASARRWADCRPSYAARQALRLAVR